MPKSVMIRPQDVRASGQVEFQPIPVNQYHRTLAEERSRFSDADLTRIYRDMATIRAFETMLNDVKIKGNYGGIEYNHRGPARSPSGASSASHVLTLEQLQVRLQVGSGSRHHSSHQYVCGY